MTAPTSAPVVAPRLPVGFRLPDGARVDRSVPARNRNGLWPPSPAGRDFTPLPPLPANRSNWARRYYDRTVDAAEAAGDLTRHEVAVLRRFLSYSSERLDDVFVSQRTVAETVGYSNDDHTNRVVAALRGKGWVTVQHRRARPRPGGYMQAMTNITRFVVPDAYRAVHDGFYEAARRQAVETRQRAAAGRQRRRTPMSREQAARVADVEAFDATVMDAPLTQRDRQRRGAANLGVTTAMKLGDREAGEAAVRAQLNDDELVEVALRTLHETLGERPAEPPG